MALMQCPECQHDVSTLAASCPNCGYPMQPQPPSLQNDPDLARLVEREKQRRAVLLFAAIMALIIIIGTIAIFSYAIQSK